MCIISIEFYHQRQNNDDDNNNVIMNVVVERMVTEWSRRRTGAEKGSWPPIT